MIVESMQNGERFDLLSPTAMPRAAGFLWNRHMMIQVNCRGYAVAQYMNPEPAKYMYAPNLEAKTFIQPEQPYYAHHPGRFFYIKDEETGELFSAPYEPVRQTHDSYRFSLGTADIKWIVQHLGIEVTMRLSLPTDDVVELWRFSVKNLSGKPRKISIYPYFPMGYMSWMNQSAQFRPELGGIVATCVSPYQKVGDWLSKVQYYKDKTFFLADREPDSFECNRELFEGEGGLHNPTAVQSDSLSNGDALYETPVAALQYRVVLAAEQTDEYRFLLGPALDDAEIEAKRDRYFGDEGFAQTTADYEAHIAKGKGGIQIETPDTHLNDFVNHWLPRQVFYLGDVNRLTTDPQTRNYLQDNMGMSYIDPAVTRKAFLHALSQQEASGAMPDGILLTEDAELKYINQIPHTDHCIWVPVCLRAYLDETDDYSILDEMVADFEGDQVVSAFDRITVAMRWLLAERDERGLSYIAQGDWCDPMNMVGYKGKGVSGWLSVAVAYALNLWAEMCEQVGRDDLATEFRAGAADVNDAVNSHLWDGAWYGRGITDDGVVFGTSQDEEGRIFLNPQSWALLANTADPEQQTALIQAVEEQLETPYGVMMFAPAFTAMRDDVGRVTQKFAGAGENGAIYNHAAVFYIYSLYTLSGGDETERAFKLLRQMITGPTDEDYLQRGQLPVFVPTYYRGAYYQHPRTAGRSSQMFNTGNVAWVYRCVIEGIFGLKGDRDGLRVEPHLPADWDSARVTRQFRGATFEVNMERRADVNEVMVTVNGVVLDKPVITEFVHGDHLTVEVLLPE